MILTIPSDKNLESERLERRKIERKFPRGKVNLRGTGNLEILLFERKVFFKKESWTSLENRFDQPDRFSTEIYLSVEHEMSKGKG